MWDWLKRARQFVQRVTGRVLGREATRSVGDINTAAGETVVSGLTDRLVADEITVGQWERGMREEIKNSYIEQYLLGRGGVAQMTFRDYGSIGGMLAEQYRYLDRFAAEIAAGELSPAQIQARSAMYIRSAREANQRAYMRAWGIPSLPAYPGGGTTKCLTNCRCHWSIEKMTDGWDCTWAIDPAAENCEDCVENAATWNPLFVGA